MKSLACPIFFLLALALALPCFCQVEPTARQRAFHVRAGGGIDYWAIDGNLNHKIGPAAWLGADIYRGIGVILEGHSMIATGVSQIKYYEGSGGLNYTLHRWRSLEPFANAEIGYASFSRGGVIDPHTDKVTYSLGVGLECHTFRHLWTHVDYRYVDLPNLVSQQTLEKHTLNPNGFSFGETYHF